MNIPNVVRQLMTGISRWLLTGFALAAMLALTVAARADDPVAMATGGQSAVDQPAPGGAADDTQDSVFNWSEVPANQQVPITRAVFDETGYQLYDTAGETIEVPFAGDNLYVMKFAVSQTGEMYFVRDGDTPILYVPDGGYLENATVQGARWYPFTPDFQPTQPVYDGIAPSWDDFVDMGWYPDMACWGGYWSSAPYFDGGVFLPMVGFTFVIGGHSCFGWAAYHTWCGGHPAPYRIGIWHGGDGGWWRNRVAVGGAFHGSGFGGERGGSVGGLTYNHGRSFAGARVGGFGERQSYSAGRPAFGAARSFWGARTAYNGGPRGFGMTRSYSFGGRGWGGFHQSRSWSGGGMRGFGGSRSFGGGGSFGTRR
jgi:hypothetical protein